MTKIPSVVEVVEAIRQRHIHLKANNPVGFVHLFADIKKALTAERLALLTELKEWTENYLKKVNKYAGSCHEENLIMLAYDAHSREIAIEHFKAHLDELINSTK